MTALTIITLCCNNISELKKTLNSIKGSLDIIEWIIVDGSSNNEIELFLYNSKYNYKYLKDKEPGIYNAINYGISSATGKYINILNSGDEGSEKCINCILNLKEEYDIIASKIKILNNNGQELTTWCPKVLTAKTKIYNMPCAHQGLFIALNLYKKFGLYDINYKLSADYEFIRRIISDNIKYKILLIIGGKFYIGGASASMLSASETFFINMKYFNGNINYFLLSLYEYLKMWLRLLLIKLYYDL